MARVSQAKHGTLTINFQDTVLNLLGVSAISLTSATTSTISFNKARNGVGIAGTMGEEEPDKLEITLTELSNSLESLLKLMSGNPAINPNDDRATITFTPNDNPANVRVLESALVENDIYMIAVDDEQKDKYLVTFIGKFTNIVENSGSDV